MPTGPGVPDFPTGGATAGSTFGTTDWLSSHADGAERAGASAVWASDHLFWAQPTVECLTALAVVAAATRRVALGTCVLQLPLRSPAAVAKQAAALQHLSGGRFVLGVGSGSHAAEYALVGAPFATRGRDLDRGIATLREAWGAERFGYRLDPAPPVPVWVGGSSAGARRRAGKLGDGWVPLFIGPGELADGLADVRGVAREAGRDPASIVPAVVMAASVGRDAARAAQTGTAWLSTLYGIPPRAFARHVVAGTATHCAETAARYADAGATHVVVMVAGDHALDQFAAIAEASRRLSTFAEQDDGAEQAAGAEQDDGTEQAQDAARGGVPPQATDLAEVGA